MAVTTAEGSRDLTLRRASAALEEGRSRTGGKDAKCSARWCARGHGLALVGAVRGGASTSVERQRESKADAIGDEPQPAPGLVAGEFVAPGGV
jgi:hypothetical protein